jgi:hypothetical protein
VFRQFVADLNRNRLPELFFDEVFKMVREIVETHGVPDGPTMGVDSTTREATSGTRNQTQMSKIARADEPSSPDCNQGNNGDVIGPNQQRSPAEGAYTWGQNVA